MRRLTLVLPGLLGSLLAVSGPAEAHQDLQLQIEQLSQELVLNPRSTDLLIKRGDLHRRHGDWVDAELDYRRVRELDASHTLIDWYEGRLLVEAGRSEDGVVLLTRFLQTAPDHPGAYRVRARALLSLGQPLQSAQDFQSAINASEKPSPVLYRALVLSWVAAGPASARSALDAAETGLSRYPREVTLLGLAVDLSLSNNDTHEAESYISRLPGPLTELPQWKFRQALWLCMEGDEDRAARLLSEMLEDKSQESVRRSGTWVLPEDQMHELISDMQPDNCRNAAWENVARQ